jgi:PPOX class probable F420-dependent enzyme
VLSDEHDRFLSEHRWALLSTTRADQTPQVSMLAYDWNGTDIVFSLRSTAAKWVNVGRQPGVVVTVADDRRFLSVHGRAERIATDPDRTALTMRLHASLLPGDAASLQRDIDAGLDASKRVVIRVVPTNIIGRV